MVEYVKGSDLDNWHWCKNCTQYPMYVKKGALIDRSLSSALNAKQKKTTKTAQRKKPAPKHFVFSVPVSRDSCADNPF